MFKLVAFLALFVICVYGHGWLVDPMPRGYVPGSQASASTTSPCGVNGTFPQTLNLTNFSPMHVAWTIGGGHTGTAGPDVCYFAYGTDPTDKTSFTTFTGSYPCPAGNHQQNFTAYISNLNPQQVYYLQFNWAAGDGSHWYNCVPMTVAPSNIKVTSVDDFNGIIRVPVNPGNVDFYSVLIPAKSYEYVAITGPSTGSITFNAQLDTLPTLDTYDSSVVVKASQSTAISFCGTATNSTAYVSVFNDPSNSGSYGFTAMPYNAQILFGQPVPQISDSLPSGGYKIFYTGAYSTSDVPKKIVLTGSDNLMVKQHTGSCTSTLGTTSVSASGGRACLNLSPSTQTKYIQVISTNDAPGPFTLGIDAGSCTAGAADRKSVV